MAAARAARAEDQDAVVGGDGRALARQQHALAPQDGGGLAAPGNLQADELGAVDRRARLDVELEQLGAGEQQVHGAHLLAAHEAQDRLRGRQSR